MTAVPQVQYTQLLHIIKKYVYEQEYALYRAGKIRALGKQY